MRRPENEDSCDSARDRPRAQTIELAAAGVANRLVVRRASHRGPRQRGPVNVGALSGPAGIDALLGLIALVGLLVAAALSDLRRRHIANRLCLAVALLAVPYWLAVEPHHPAVRLAVQLALALAIGVVLFGAFAANLLGGGDVKLLTALALWLPPASLARALLIAAMAGGALGLAILILARRRIAEPTVPYGVAIAVAGIAEAAPHIASLLTRA